MEDRECHRGIFSTANGKYAYRESRQCVRTIFREDYRDDMEDMACRIRQEFPQKCKLMTAADACHVGRYFDGLDIQTQTHVFLYDVLMRIVVYNFEEARQRVQEYVNSVLLDPVRYEGLTANDLEIHVFSDEERDLVGYDNTLPAALSILKSFKFPPAFNKAIVYSNLEPQKPVGTDKTLDSATIVVTPATDSCNGLDPSSSPPVATEAQYRPRGGGHKEYSHVDLDDGLTNDRFSKPANANHGQRTTSSTVSEPSTYSEPTRPDDLTPITTQLSPSTLSPSLHLEQVSRGPVANSHIEPKPATCRERPSGPTAELNDRSSGSSQTAQHSSTYCQQDSKGLRQFKGIQHPAKKIPDGIRRKSITKKSQSLLPPHSQSQGMPVIVLPPQHLLKKRCGLPIADRMASIRFSTSFNAGHHQRSSVDSAIPDSSPALVPYYPRPESCRARFESGDARVREVRINENSMNPRVLPHSSHPPILEDPKGERAPINRMVRSFTLEYKSSRITQNSTTHHGSVLRSSYPPKASTLPRAEAHELIQYDPQSTTYFNENHLVPTQHNNRQLLRRSQTQSQHGRPHLGQDQLYDHYSHRQSSIKEYSSSQGLIQPADDCILFVSGLPEHLDAKAIWEMLSPVRGLKWIAPFDKAQNREGHIFTSIFFHEPFFAAEALELLPRTTFAAMNGRFLSVRRPTSDRADPLRYWDPSIHTWSEYSIHPIRRSREFAFPGQSQVISPPHIPDQHSRFPTSESGRTTQIYESVAPNLCIANRFSGYNDYPLTLEAGQGLNGALRDNGVKPMQIPATSQVAFVSATAQPHNISLSEPVSGGLEAMDERSTPSTGSPVKRVKRKGTSISRVGRNRSKDSTGTLLKQLDKDRPETPKEDFEEIAMDAIEMEAVQPEKTNIPAGCANVKSAATAKLNTGGEPETLKRSEQETQARNTVPTTQKGHSTSRHLIETARTLTDQSAMQLSQTKLSLQQTIKVCKESEHLPLLSEVPQNVASNGEARSLELTPLTRDAEIDEQDLVGNQVAVPKDSTANTSCQIPSSTKGQQLAAKASQRQFEGDFPQTQTKPKDSYLKGKSQRLDMALKTTDRQPTIKVLVAEKASDSRRQMKAPRGPRQSQHPATDILLHQSRPASAAVEASRLCPKEIDIALSAEKDSLSSIDEHVYMFSSQPIGGSPSVEGKSSIARPSPPMASLTTCLYKGSSKDTGGHDTPTSGDVALKTNDSYELPPTETSDTMVSHENCVGADVQSDSLSQPELAAFSGNSPHVPLDVVDLTLALPLPMGEITHKEATSVKPQAPSKKVAFGERRMNKSPGSCLIPPKHMLELKAMHASDEVFNKGLDESKRGDTNRSTVDMRGITEIDLSSKDTIVSDQAETTTSMTSRGSPDRPVRLPVPPRSSSLVQLPTSSPILTRKKKQKKFFPCVSEERVELHVSSKKETGAVQQWAKADFESIGGGGSEVAQKVGIVNEASEQNLMQPQSSQKLDQVTNTKRSSPKSEPDDTETSERILTYSTLDVTPPKTPPSESSSSLENSPDAPGALVNNSIETFKEVSNVKSNNRKKNRPGKKKSKSSRTLSLDLKGPVSALLVTDLGTANPKFSLHDCVVLCGLEKPVLERKEFQCVKQSSAEEVTGHDAHSGKLDGGPSSFKLNINNNSEESSEDDVDVIQTVDLKQANPKAEDQESSEALRGSSTSSCVNASLLQTARDAGYSSATGILSMATADRSELRRCESSLQDMVCPRELRPQCSRAAIKRIQQKCDYETETQKSLRSEVPLCDINHFSPEVDTDFKVIESPETYQNDTCEDRTGHSQFSEKQPYVELRGIERVVTLDLELQSIIREAVQMASPFISDKDDLQKGILYTLDSMRATRILKVTDFLEVSPLNGGHDRDTKWMSEWCDEAAQWLHCHVPRMTESQKEAMYKWEVVNPSMEMNLMALGFTSLEIDRCGLIRVPKVVDLRGVSIQHKQEPKNSMPLPISCSENLNVTSSAPYQLIRDTQEESQTEIHLTIKTSYSESDEPDFQLEEIDGVECGPKPVTDIEAGKQESRIIQAKGKMKLKRGSHPMQEKKGKPPGEEKEVILRKERHSVSTPSNDAITDMAPMVPLKWKTVSDRLSIAAAIKQNEEDLHGKSLARKYKKFGQSELKTLGLAPSLLTTTTNLSSTLPQSNILPDSPSADTVAPMITPKFLGMPRPLTPALPIRAYTIDTSTAQETPLEPEEPLVRRPSYATALQSPIGRPDSSPQGIRTPKSAFTITSQASDSKCNKSRDTDAWALPGEETWGITPKTIGNGHLN